MGEFDAGLRAAVSAGREALYRENLERMIRRNQRRRMAVALIYAVLSLGLQVAGAIILWRHDPWLVLAMGLMLWGYGIGLRAVFKRRKD